LKHSPLTIALDRSDASFEAAQTSVEPRYFFGEQFEIRNDMIETVEKRTRVLVGRHRYHLSVHGKQEQ